MLSAVFAVLFGLSLLPGRKPLCLRFAERLSGGIMPEGAPEYCRTWTVAWFAVLAALSVANAAILAFAGGGRALAFSAFLAPCAVAATFWAEGRARRRRFSVAFRTSGSTGGPKTVVKTFESLAREAAYHRDWYLSGRDRPCIVPGRTLFLATVEPGHMYGTLWREMLPKALGCEVDPDVIATPEALVAKMAAAESVFLVTTPSFLDRFTAYADQYEVPRNCVEVVSSGSLLSTAVAARAKAVFGVAPREIFGSTETGGVAWRRQDSGGETWQVFGPVRVSRVEPEGRLSVRSPFSFRRRYAMGDAVELSADGRSFALLGRVDRLVKINEERVNLAEMEEAVRAIGFADCALAVLEGGRGPCLGALLVAGGAMREAGVSLAPLDLRRLLLPLFPKGTVPKRIRAVRALPRNAQGKVVASEVRAWLESSLVEPEFVSERTADGRTEIVLRFRADAPYFRGHFPGFPILPGVAQLGLAVRYASSVFGEDRAVRQVKRMKFTWVVRPGDEVRLSLVRRAPGEIAYEYLKGDRSCSSGVLVF